MVYYVSSNQYFITYLHLIQVPSFTYITSAINKIPQIPLESNPTYLLRFLKKHLLHEIYAKLQFALNPNSALYSKFLFWINI